MTVLRLYTQGPCVQKQLKLVEFAFIISPFLINHDDLSWTVIPMKTPALSFTFTGGKGKNNKFIYEAIQCTCSRQKITDNKCLVNSLCAFKS